MALSKYGCHPTESDLDGGIPVHTLSFERNPRAFVPTASEKDIEGAYHTVAFDASGDWSWQPGRSNVATPTYRPRRHPRACVCCGLTACLSLISHAGVCG